ncbi:hypothetical protein [Rhodococcus jostii]|uniref:hypothetical protein n=1 Tax=Rhodococcus jostii TaxID=132919 RepID=UPI000317FEA8|nr:hypothetical protein [Rhodococcus jostii]
MIDTLIEAIHVRLGVVPDAISAIPASELRAARREAIAAGLVASAKVPYGLVPCNRAIRTLVFSRWWR